ncbi:MAG: S8 family serine peptidase [Candidatus Omnitrophica bacterium]|nr:S8 family serine peptidase [Candidatus Omnitrophota bacterium]MBU4488530.1 S8 family serine peptidase [Candidatus Omnitrophota bacterium]MCG2704555.1 S8 family serine peptidase [Candidatus Omnitrophota bacterium]
MKSRTTLFVCLLFLTFFIISSFAFAADQKSPTEIYLDELQAQGKERVIVSFNDDAIVDTSLVDKYGGKLIRLFTTIKALVCEIPQENIELLKQEESVKNVYPDVIVRAQPGSEERDPKELRNFLRLKKGYFREIREARLTTLRQATREYLQALKAIAAERKRLVKLYNEAVRNFRNANKKNKPIYQAQIAQYAQLLKECRLKQKEAREEYKRKVEIAKSTYVTASGEWEEKVNEQMMLLYSGPAEVKWNNLEAGLNSQAAWDRYDLDGAGIKIAFLDTGVNYDLLNLQPSYLGGTDFVEDDGNPLTTDVEENHGTKVVSLAVGRGDDKVVGVAYRAGFYAVKVLDASGTGWGSDVWAGIEWASAEPHKADIISMSLGAYDEDYPLEQYPLWPYERQEFENKCNNAYNAGIILVAASGNRGYDHSSYPAAFTNVISVGGHAEDQTRYVYEENSSDGGVDIVAPGSRVYTVKPDNSTWWVWGTSFSTAHAAGLIALQLQYARQNHTDIGKKMQPNNGYLWEVMKHSAVYLPNFDPDPEPPDYTDYQGNGKIWAAETDPPPVPPYVPKDGSIDAMASEWPLSYDVVYDNYLYLEEDLYPAYYIGTSMYYDVNLTNNTDTAGNYLSDIEDLNVTATQAYYQHQSEAILPGSPICAFSTISSLTAGSLEILPDTYYLPWAMVPGLNRTALDLEFEFADDTNNRLIKVSYPYANLWCPPAAVNEGFPLE